MQCGFCTPGLIVAVARPLAATAAPTELEVREALSGNLCRCTGYGRILAAVQRAADAPGGPRDRRRPGRRTGTPGSRPRARRQRRPAPTAAPRCRAGSRSPPTWGRRAAVGQHAALAAPVRPRSSASTPSARWRIPGVARGDHRRRRPRPPTYGLDRRRPAGVRPRRRALRRRARRGRRRRPSRDLPAGAGGDRRRLRGARAAHRPRGGLATARRRSIPTATCCRHQRIRRGDAERDGADRRRGRPTRSACRTRPSSGPRRPGRPDRGRRRRAVHRDPVAARGPRAGRGLPGPARRTRCG